MQVLRAKLLVFLVVGSQCAAFNCTQSDVGNFSKANDVLVLGHKNISVLDNTTLDSCANLTNKERIRYLDFSCASLLCRAGACSPDHCWLPVTPGHYPAHRYGEGYYQRHQAAGILHAAQPRLFKHHRWCANYPLSRPCVES